VSDPHAHPPGPNPSFPPDYPYGTPPVGADPALSFEPGRGASDAPPWGSATGYPGTVPGVPPGMQPGVPQGLQGVPQGWQQGMPPGMVPAMRPLVATDPVAANLRAHAIAALIVSSLLAVPCLAIQVIPAIVMSAVAVSRVRTNLPLARLLVRISWVWIALSAALSVGFVVWTVATSTPATTS
jgi:hypothetical protein